MRFTARVTAVSALILALGSTAAAQDTQGVMGDLIRDVNQAQNKITGLAKAIPADAYDWRPSKEVRSTSEVLMHVAADNYFIPSALGIAPPDATGIKAGEYPTAVAFEKKTLKRDQVIAELEQSFAFLKKSMSGFPAAKMDAQVEVFGQKATPARVWLSAVTHLHEHLGQLIAYARSNNVTPPWSK